MSDLSELYTQHDTMELTMMRVRKELVALRHTLDTTPEWEQEPLRIRERQLLAEQSTCYRYEAIGLQIRENENRANGVIWEIAEVDRVIALLKRAHQGPRVVEDLAEHQQRRVY